MSDRFLAPAKPQQQNAEIAVRIRIISIDPKSLVELLRRFVRFPQSRQGDGKVIVSLGIIGPNPQCSPKQTDRLNIAPLARESEAKIVVSIRIIMTDFQSLSELGNGFIQPALLVHQRVAEVVVGKLIARSDGERVIPQCFTILPV